MRKSPLNAFFSLLLLSILLVLSFVVQAQADSTWNIQTVDANGALATGISMVLDSKDNPHLCYTDYENGYYSNPRYLMYASWNGSDWNTENVTYEGRVGYSGLALDSDDNPHIAYVGSGLMYASWTGEDWSIQTVDPEGDVGSLFFDSADNPHIIYGGANGALKYAVLKDSNWSIQVVDTKEGLGSTKSLTLDSNDHPHIIYGYSTGNGNMTVKYATWNGSSWNFQTVISNADVSFGNIVLDSKGYPHFTYYNQTSYSPINGLLMYASWNGASCSTQVVDTIIAQSSSGFLNLDSNNIPHISYIKGVLINGNYEAVLMHAEWTSTAWSIQTVDSSNYIMGIGSVVLDSRGNPCISYFGQPSLRMYIASVMYATRTPILSPYQILGIALLVSLPLAIAIAVIVKRMVKKNEKRKH